jgi:23S rRNA (uracil1939-C5)-methyltransferase
VTLRAGARTGERLVVADPSAEGVVVPAGVAVIGTDELRAGRRAWFHEAVAGRTWRVSADSFFQARPDGAEALVETVTAEVAAHASDAGTMVDLCGGVGLFAGTVGADRSVVLVERNRSAVADAAVNLADLDVRIVRSSFEGWRPSRADVVVADPARRGLGKEGVAAAAATGARLVVLVSCDPASLGRDAGLFTKAGFEPTTSTVIDLFPQTSHVEVVTGFIR